MMSSGLVAGNFSLHVHARKISSTKPKPPYIYLGFQKPVFKSFPGSPIIVMPNKLNKGYYFTYEVEGIPTPSITWYKINGEKEELLIECKATTPSSDCLDEPNLYISRTEFDKYSVSFPDDNATLKCVASNSLGTVTKTIQINIKGKKTASLSCNTAQVLIHIMVNHTLHYLVRCFLLPDLTNI
jgi:hypothetical protein